MGITSLINIGTNAVKGLKKAVYVSPVCKIQPLDMLIKPREITGGLVDSNLMTQESSWKLFNGKILEDFIASDSSIAKILSEYCARLKEYRLEPDIKDMLRMEELSSELKQFFGLLKSKYNIDLKMPPKVYRFIGKSELETLISHGEVRPQRWSDKIDVTIDPNLNWNPYRVTFKPDRNFSILERNSKVTENYAHQKEYYYYLNDKYTIDDVEKIERIYG